MKALYIIGFWNSGTTLLVELLKKHPNYKLKRARFLPNLEERTIFKLLKKIGVSPPDFNHDYKEAIATNLRTVEPVLSNKQKELFKKYFLKKFKVSSNKILLLKNPWLFFLLNLVQDTMCDASVVNAKKVLVLRDGPAQNISAKIDWNMFAEKEEHLIERAKFWVTCMEYFFETWYKDENMLVVRYENLCANPREIVKQILEFQEVDYTEKFINKLPEKLENRTGRKDSLPEDIKNRIIEITNPVQKKIDNIFPVL